MILCDIIDFYYIVWQIYAKFMCEISKNKLAKQ